MRQMAAMQAGLAGTAGAFGAAGAAGSRFGNTLGRVRADRFGSQMQWLGRQLEYNFTLPILAAGAAATHWALENEKAFTRVTKVYGDATRGAEFYHAELKSLERAFVALSNQFGVHQAEVINIAADWAAAGASGIALAKATELTLKTMILGEMEAKQATKALIAIQAQYGLSTEQLTEAIATLNMVENQTGASLADLVDGFSRAAGVARSAGVDVRHLAAMMSALVPTTGTAAQAGNALKTIFSRLISPTGEAREVMELMGISIDDLAWKSSNVTDRLIIMAEKFAALSDSQKGVVSSVVASRWQINKFEVLMRELLSTTGFYARALDATTDKQQLFNQMQRELNAVLTSNPRRLQVLWTMLQNAMADIIQPMIPLILAAAASIQSLVQSFSELDPALQKLILGFLVFIALVGPVVRYLGSLRTLVVELTLALFALATPFRVIANWFKILLGYRVAVWAASAVAALTAFGARLAFLGRLMAVYIGVLRSGFVVMMAATSAFMMGMHGVMAAGLLGIQRLWAIAGALLVASLTRLWYFPLALTTQRFMARFAAMWTALMLGIQRIVAVGGLALAGVWSAVMLGTQRVMAAAHVSLAATWGALMVTLRSVTIAGGAGLTAVWAAVLLTMRNMTIVFSATLAGIWRAMAITATAMGAAVAAGFGRGFALLFVWIRGIGPKLIALARSLGLALTVAFSGPWGWAVAAVVIILIAFRKQLAEIWTNILNFFRGNTKQLGQAVSPIGRMFAAVQNAIIRAFNALPAGVRNALIAVVRIVHAAAMKVYELMQWMNPFARHSPSLVENVVNGMAIIRSEFASVAGAAEIFAKAGLDLESFGLAVREIQRVADAKEWAELRKELVELAPSAVPTFDRLVSVLNPLKDLLLSISTEMRAQQAVVDPLKASLDQANIAYEEQEAVLRRLQDVADDYRSQLDEAERRMSDFANAPIVGMKAMQDAIFANTMEQKRLQLEMMRMEDVVGPLDKLQDKIHAINADIELLSGEQNDLRRAGAGSDILSGYEEQIGILEEQKRVIEDQVRPIQALADEIENLNRQGQMLDLENSLAFDPLKKQIDDVANAMRELPFDEIMAGVTDARADVDRLTTAFNSATEAVNAQQAIVDRLKDARDALQATYDIENAKLQEIKDRYSEVEERIRAIEQAFRDVGQAAAAVRGGGRMSPGAENFLGAEGGDFPDVGGLGGVGREGGLEDQAKMIDDFTKELAAKTQNMFGLFNFLEPVKKAWNASVDWLKKTLGPSLSFVGDAVKAAFTNVSNPFKDVDWAKAAGVVENAIKKVGDALRMIWELIGPELKKLFSETWTALQDAFKDIQPELAKFKELIGPMMDVTKQLWTILAPILGAVLALVLLVLKAFIGALAGGIGPFIRMIGDLLAGIIRVIRGLYEFVAGVFTGNWKLAWKGVVDIFGGIWDIIWGILKGVVLTLVGLVKGLVMGIVDWFIWLWDVLVGHSIIPDIINGIISWFTKLGDFLSGLVESIVRFFSDMWHNKIRPVFDLFKAGMQALWDKHKEVVGFIIGKWNEFVDKIFWVRDRLNNGIENIKGIFQGLASKAQDVWNNLWQIGEHIVNHFNNLRNRFSFNGLFDGLVNAFRNAINQIVDKWNSLDFGVGPFNISTPNIPFFARGGMITDGAMAIVGEGRQNFPEYVIPTDPAYRNRALGLFIDLARQLGLGSSRDNAIIGSIMEGQRRGLFAQKVQMFASGGILGRGGRVKGMGGAVVIAPSTTRTEVHFHGDLQFPNVRTSDDAEAFLRNLEALISEA